MTRALSVTCLSLAFALLSATAEGKPTVAVLGLEVSTPDNGQMDQQTTAAANNLTVALRDRVRSGTGPYDTAPGSDKELIDLKLLNECSSEAMPCMVKIGNDLGAKFILYGHVAKSSGTYRVSVTLLNVDNKSKGMSKSFDVPGADLIGGPKSKDTLVWARKIYGELTGETSQGTVIVRVTGADHGTLLVLENGTWQPKGSITSGQGRTTLPEGKYKIAVESEGFQRFESTVTVTSGQDSSIPVKLEAMPTVGTGSDTPLTGAGSGDGHVYGGTISDPGGGNGWHSAFVGTAITTGVLAVGFGVSFGELASTGKSTKNGGGTFQYGGNCATDSNGNVTGGGQCANGKLWRDSAYITGIGAIAIGGFALIALYESHRSSSDSTTEHVLRNHRARKQFAVVPVVSPTSAGATFRLEW